MSAHAKSILIGFWILLKPLQSRPPLAGNVSVLADVIGARMVETANGRATTATTTQAASTMGNFDLIRLLIRNLLIDKITYQKTLHTGERVTTDPTDRPPTADRRKIAPVVGIKNGTNYYLTT